MTEESDRGSPSSEFILRRIIKNDQQELPGHRLNAEMRGEFTRMLRQREEARDLAERRR